MNMIEKSIFICFEMDECFFYQQRRSLISDTVARKLNIAPFPGIPLKVRRVRSKGFKIHKHNISFICL